MQFKHFIILDDDPLSRLLNEMVVIHAGRDLQFTTFHDPQDCLTHIRITPPDPKNPICLLLDINMPKLNGWEFLTELKTFPKASRIIITSSLLHHLPTMLICFVSRSIRSFVVISPSR